MKESNFKFTDPVLTKIEYEIKPFEARTQEKAIGIANTFKVNIKRAEDAKEACVELEILVGDRENKSEPFYIDITVGALFKWDETYDEQTVQDLLSVNAPALLIGYARPIIATITNMSPFPAYNLPFYNFTE